MKDVMRKLGVLLVVATLTCGWVLAGPLDLGDVSGTIVVGDRVLVAHSVGGLLPNAPTYDWWYGCSPTSAGMMAGYYDINGYNSLLYGNLVPGGVAELNTFGNAAAIANQAIASSGANSHVADFYVAGYGASGDDLPVSHSFNCLADFMGTSQDAAGNVNGGTTFYYWTNGAPFTPADAVANAITVSSGMYGIGEYVQYAGYNYSTLYNQYIDTLQLAQGFTLPQYQAEIDAGRPVMVHITNHSMFGYGYVAGTSDINVYDTWAPAGQNPGTLTWGTAYGTTSLDHYGVTVLAITGGQDDQIPEPLSVTLLAFGALGLLRRRRKMAA